MSNFKKMIRKVRIYRFGLEELEFTNLSSMRVSKRIIPHSEFPPMPRHVILGTWALEAACSVRDYGLIIINVIVIILNIRIIIIMILLLLLLLLLIVILIMIAIT